MDWYVIFSTQGCKMEWNKHISYFTSFLSLSQSVVSLCSPRRQWHSSETLGLQISRVKTVKLNDLVKGGPKYFAPGHRASVFEILA